MTVLDSMETEHQTCSTSEKKSDKLPRTMAEITPLEPPLHDFAHSTGRMEIDSMDMSKAETLAALQIHTPPETPEVPEVPHFDCLASAVGQDELLFPDSPLRDRTRSLSPLLENLNKRIDLNDHDESTERFQGSSFDLHRRTESTTYPAILGIQYAHEALDYHRSCVEEQRRFHRELALPAPARSSKTAHRDPTSTQQLSRLNKSSGVTKVRNETPRPVPRPVVATTPKPTQSPRKAPAPRKRASRAKAVSEGPSETSQGQKKHTRAAPTKNVNVPKWRDIEDFTPPLHLLDGKTFDIKWDGSTRDISSEPDIDRLHELEVKWASKLRLDPGLFLATKRLIFRERVKFLKAGRVFTKTAAQSAAKLDVNKLSRLHSAFEAVGWFEEGLFQQFLE